MSGTLFAVSAAWFQGMNQAKLSSGQGYTASAYFAGGDGSEATPYIINQPIHLYNLAWLQYLGLFNKTENGAYKQTYFVLGSDVDMSPSSGITWTLPPIGTTDNPFIGNFDGKGYTISNLVVDNTLGDGHISHKPTTVDSLAGVNIVGTFGVVGAYNLDSTITYSSAVNSVKDVKLSSVEVKSSLSQTLIGIGAGYVNATINQVGIENSKTTVASGSTAISGGPTTSISDYTTVGYCTDSYKGLRDKRTTTVQAGATDHAYFSSLNSGANAGWGGSIAMSDIFTRLKGFIADTAHSSVLDTSTIVTSETINIASDGTQTTATTTLGTAGKILNYFDDTSNATKSKGSFSFDYYDSSAISTNTNMPNYEFLMLYGKKEWTKSITTNTHTIVTGGTGYKIAYNSYYLYTDGTTVSYTTDSDSATIWSIPEDGATGTISAIVDNASYYLNPEYTLGSWTDWRGRTNTYVESSSVSISTTSSNLWTRSGSTFYLPITTYYYGTSTDDYYLEFSNDYWTLTTSNIDLDLTETTGTIDQVTSEVQRNQPSASTNDTFFPLNVNTDNTPANTNTGYIISGANVATDEDNEYFSAGDIRVSKFPMTSLYRSLSGSSSSTTFSSSKFEILTQNNDGVFRIKDLQGETGNYSNDNNKVNSQIRNITTKPYTGTNGLGFKKYRNSRTSLDNVLRGSTTPTATAGSTSPIYGLHFVDASIGYTADKLVKAPVALVNKTTYYDYCMPRDSIDFNLEHSGFINFFAGTYYVNSSAAYTNNTFFSLHQITRNSKDATKIDKIQEISKIYASTSDSTADYVYSFVDSTSTSGETLPTAPTGYTKKFDMTWVKTPTKYINNAAYYYEIPVNKGEYALGSVSGKNGAYLMYLDISANAQPIARTVITEYVLYSDAQYEYPSGVAILATSETLTAVDPLNSVAVALSSSYSGSFGLSKSDSTITMSSDQNGFSPGYLGDNLTLARTLGDLTVPEVVPKATPTTSYLKRMTYIDYNTVTKETTRTVFTSTNGTMTYSQIDNDGNVSTPTDVLASNGEYVAITTITDASIVTSGLSTINAEYLYSYFADKSTVTAEYVFTYALNDGTIAGQTTKVASITGYTITLTSTGETVQLRVDLLSATYVITLNGTTIATGPIPAA